MRFFLLVLTSIVVFLFGLFLPKPVFAQTCWDGTFTCGKTEYTNLYPPGCVISQGTCSSYDVTHPTSDQSCQQLSCGQAQINEWCILLGYTDGAVGGNCFPAATPTPTPICGGGAVSYCSGGGGWYCCGSGQYCNPSNPSDQYYSCSSTPPSTPTPTSPPIQCYGACGNSTFSGSCTVNGQSGTYSWDGNGAGTTSCGNGSTPYCYNCVAGPTPTQTTCWTCANYSSSTCGTQSDNCGGTINCGACPTPTPGCNGIGYTCNSNCCSGLVCSAAAGSTCQLAPTSTPAPTSPPAPVQICVPNSVISTTCSTTPC